MILNSQVYYRGKTDEFGQLGLLQGTVDDFEQVGLFGKMYDYYVHVWEEGCVAS